MSSRNQKKMLAALLSFALLVGVGCSSLPTQPQVDSPTAAAQNGEAAQPMAGAIPLVESVSSVELIDGRIGGQVSAGDFTVVLPAKFIKGIATVRVTQPDLTKPFVQLDISPASANSFKMPVILTANASAMDPKRMLRAYIAWFDPATGKWVPMASTVNPLTGAVSCPLTHFSDYEVEVDGKAGW